MGQTFVRTVGMRQMLAGTVGDRNKRPSLLCILHAGAWLYNGVNDVFFRSFAKFS